ncbi:MAG TPA: hypothetical protein VFN85_02050 [Solirubrobacterales bacterium]|nr:hypothetical protein [Solirubrobacterales bacterium]
MPMRYLHLCAHEQFPPDQLLGQAVARFEGEHGAKVGRELRPNPRLQPVA